MRGTSGPACGVVQGKCFRATWGYLHAVGLAVHRGWMRRMLMEENKRFSCEPLRAHVLSADSGEAKSLAIRSLP